MILMVSSRCDIVAFYFPWFLNRIKAGFLHVRNPYNPKMVSLIEFNDVEGIVFCTKNPTNLLENIDQIKIPFLVQVTVTGYHHDLQPNLEPVNQIIDSIILLSTIIGKRRISLRYDPIILNDRYTLEYHFLAFEKLCHKLANYVFKIIISFVDDYQNTLKNQSIIKKHPFTTNDYHQIGLNFSRIAKHYQIPIQTCNESIDLIDYGFNKGSCFDLNDYYYLTNSQQGGFWRIKQAPHCQCRTLVDIGVYNSCRYFCRYCYANYLENQVNRNYHLHDPNSSLLIGQINDDDIIKKRKKD